MREKHPEMAWEVMDVREMSCEGSSFDLAIDKVLRPTWYLISLGAELTLAHL